METMVQVAETIWNAAPAITWSFLIGVGAGIAGAAMKERGSLAGLAARIGAAAVIAGAGVAGLAGPETYARYVVFIIMLATSVAAFIGMTMAGIKMSDMKGIKA